VKKFNIRMSKQDCNKFVTYRNITVEAASEVSAYVIASHFQRQGWKFTFEDISEVRIERTED
jgi:hypothetical protein